MTGARSFIDVLFILLLGTLVMLTRSVQLGAVEADLVRVGGGAVSPLRADEVQVIAVGIDALIVDGIACADPSEAAAKLRVGRPVLIVVIAEDVSFQRVLSVWSFLRERGHDVSLGAEPTAPESPAPEHEDPGPDEIERGRP